MKTIVIIALTALLVFFLCRAYEYERPHQSYTPVTSSRTGDPVVLPAVPVREPVTPYVTPSVEPKPQEQYYAVITEEIITEEVEQ